MPFTNILDPAHLIIILVIAVLILGPKRLPEMGRSVGQSIREFRNVFSGESESEKDSGKRTAAIGEEKKEK